MQPFREEIRFYPLLSKQQPPAQKTCNTTFQKKYRIKLNLLLHNNQRMNQIALGDGLRIGQGNIQSRLFRRRKLF